MVHRLYTAQLGGYGGFLVRQWSEMAGDWTGDYPGTWMNFPTRLPRDIPCHVLPQAYSAKRLAAASRVSRTPCHLAGPVPLAALVVRQLVGRSTAVFSSIKWCRQWCREVPTMVPYSSPRSVAIGIVLHRNDGRTPDYVSKDKRHKPQGRWRLRRLFASDCFDLHRIAPEVRETGVEPARVSPLDPKCSKFTFLLHRAHRTFGWQPLTWQ